KGIAKGDRWISRGDHKIIVLGVLYRNLEAMCPCGLAEGTLRITRRPDVGTALIDEDPGIGLAQAGKFHCQYVIIVRGVFIDHIVPIKIGVRGSTIAAGGSGIIVGIVYCVGRMYVWQCQHILIRIIVHRGDDLLTEGLTFYLAGRDSP